MFVSAVVVHNQMQRDFSGELLVQPSKEPQELLVAMPLMALADHAASQNFQSGEQGGRSVALVVRRHGPATAFFQRQPRLRTIQRLNLGLFVYAQYDRLLRRI